METVENIYKKERKTLHNQSTLPNIPSYFPSNLSNINPLPSNNYPVNIININNNNHNNNKNLYTSSFMSSIIENQIKKIDERAQNQLKKEEEDLLKICEEESKLPFDQRLII